MFHPQHHSRRTCSTNRSSPYTHFLSHTHHRPTTSRRSLQERIIMTLQLLGLLFFVQNNIIKCHCFYISITSHLHEHTRQIHHYNNLKVQTQTHTQNNLYNDALNRLPIMITTTSTSTCVCTTVANNMNNKRKIRTTILSCSDTDEDEDSIESNSEYEIQNEQQQKQQQDEDEDENDHRNDNDEIKGIVVGLQKDNRENNDDKGKEESKEQPNNNNNNKYKPPKFSQSFLKHMEQVRKSRVYNNEEGVECDGEPSVDPSRMVQDNGLDSEYLNDYSM